MPLLRHGSNLIFFAQIPKTGGTSVESALRAAGAKRGLSHHKRLGYAKATPQHMHAAIYTRFIPEDFYDYGFTVTRHPFDRLLSEYKWRIELGHVDKPFNAWVGNNLARFEDQPYVLDNHIRPQTEFLAPSIEVFRFEDGLAEPLRRAADALGLVGVDPETHKRMGEKLTVEWTPETRDAALAFYRSDFETLGYDPSDTTPDIRLV